MPPPYKGLLHIDQWPLVCPRRGPQLPWEFVSVSRIPSYNLKCLFTSLAMWQSAAMARETVGRRLVLKHKNPPLALWLVGVGIRLAMQHNFLATTICVKTFVTSLTGK